MVLQPTEQVRLCECGICGLPVSEGINPRTKQPYRFRKGHTWKGKTGHRHNKYGITLSKEHRTKISIALKDSKTSPKTRLKHSIANKGKTSWLKG